MSTSVGRINLDLGINTSGFKNQLNGITKQTGGLTSALGKVAKVAAVAFSVKAIVSFSKQCLKLGSDLQEVQNVVDVTFGSMSAKVDEFAENAMTSFGLSEKVAKQYMGTFGAMSKSFGYTTEAAYEQAAALTGLAGDVASFYNLTTDEAYTKLKSVFTGETESLKELGVVMTQTALDEYALQQGMGKTTSQMSEQEKVALRLAFVQDRLATASGDFARTSDGWANQTRVLALRFDALKASIGQGLIVALTPVIKVLNQLMAHLQKAADMFADFMQALFGKQKESPVASLGTDLSAGSGDLAANSADAAKSAKSIKKSLMGFDKLNILGGSSDSSGGGGGTGGGAGGGASSIPSMLPTDADTGAVDKIKTALDGIKQKLLELANITGFSDLWDKALIGVNNVKTGIGNLFSSFKEALANNAPNFEELKTSLSNTFLTTSNTITTIWGDMWTSLTEGFSSFTEENGPAIEEFFTNIIGTIAGHFTFVSDVFGDMITSISEWWNTDGKPIFDGIVEVFKDVGEWLLHVYNTYIDPVIDTVQELLTELWDNHLKPLWDDILELVTAIGKCILQLWNTVLKPVIDWVTDILGPVFKNVFKSIASFVKNAIGVVVDIIRGLINTLKNIINFITAIFQGDWDAAWDAIVSQFEDYWNMISSVAKGVVNAIIDVVNALWSLVYGSIRNVVNGLGKVVETIGKVVGKDWGFSMPADPPKIAHLATGGYVKANTPQLAVIGDNKREGEIVAPESKIAEAVAAGFAMVMSKMRQPSGNKDERPIYLTLKLGEGTFWEGFVDYHNSIVKRTGDSPLLV